MAKKKSNKDEIVVKHRDHQGKPTERTFSKDVHGDDFADLADEFKKTNKNSIIDDEPEADEVDDTDEADEDE